MGGIQFGPDTQPVTVQEIIHIHPSSPADRIKSSGNMTPALLFLSPIPFSLPHPSRNALQRTRTTPTASLILGLNQYTHDASVAIIHAQTGHLLYAQSKERLSRKKHDAGDLSLPIRHALNSIHARPQDVTLVVANNHHFRIAPFEKRLPFTVSLRYQPHSYLCPFNLLGATPSHHTTARKIELSHHLAHAYSAAYAAPFDRGVVLIMDGMGDALDDWLVAGAPETKAYDKSTVRDSNYYTEESVCRDAPDFREFPPDVRSRPGASFREAETAYVFSKKDGRLQFTRLFKRWTQEIAPPELPNHSFEEMTSVGAMYSRVSAILFKDWNACGKVMGLAPYARTRANQIRQKDTRFFLRGNLFDGTLSVREGQLKGLEFLHKSMSDCDDSEEGRQLRQHFEDLAYHVQEDLEDVVMTLVSELMDCTGEENLVFGGGVALNSSVNGRLSEHTKVNQFYVPPFPGDEGISLGCALFGYSSFSQMSGKPYQPRNPFMPYLGKQYSEADVMDAIECFSPWITWRSEDSNQATARALNDSKVVAWFSGRSEFGPRALGCRSILADPRNPSMLDHVNKIVKKRERFRPFAPTVLSEHAPSWFCDCSSVSSPYMSLIKRAKKPAVIPAVVHVDGTSRLQTLAREDNPAYHDMISRFYEITGVPLVLNTSFNVAGEPIVESPVDALVSFLAADGIDYLVFPGVVVENNAVTSLSDGEVVSTACTAFRSEQVQDSWGYSLRTIVRYIPKDFADTGPDDTADEFTVEMTDELQLSILELIHASGSCMISSIVQDFSEPESGEATRSCLSEIEAPSPTEVKQRIADLCNQRLVYICRGDQEFQLDPTEVCQSAV